MEISFIEGQLIRVENVVTRSRKGMSNKGEDWNRLSYIAPGKKYVYEEVINIGMHIGQIFEEEFSGKPFASHI